MTLKELLRTIREQNPPFEVEETGQSYEERIYHLALMAWERVPENEKAPDAVEEVPVVSEPVQVVENKPAEEKSEA